MPVQMYTLHDLTALIPEQPSITSMHLKVDAEGADLVVLKGARDAIPRFDTVIIECNGFGITRQFRDGECKYEVAQAYMKEQGFNGMGYSPQGDLANMFFYKSPSTPPLVPTYLKGPPLEHRRHLQMHGKRPNRTRVMIFEMPR